MLHNHADRDGHVHMMVVLVRHLATNIGAGICYGRMDMPLRPDSLADVPRLAAEICAHGIARVWTSPAARCCILADAIVAIAGTSAIIDPRLQELNFGEWEGLAWDSIPRSEIDRWAAAPLSFAPPGGESGQEFLDRMHEVHQAISAVGEDCVVVTHGGPLKVLTTLLQGYTPDLRAPAPAFGSVAIITC